jgi:hypothetical protein
MRKTVFNKGCFHPFSNMKIYPIIIQYNLSKIIKGHCDRLYFTDDLLPDSVKHCTNAISGLAAPEKSAQMHSEIV